MKQLVFVFMNDIFMMHDTEFNFSQVNWQTFFLFKSLLFKILSKNYFTFQHHQNMKKNIK